MSPPIRLSAHMAPGWSGCWTGAKGPLREFWSIDVNAKWRIIFKFRKGDAYEVKITDETH